MKIFPDGSLYATSEPIAFPSLTADSASGRSADCQCRKCQAKRRTSGLTIADLERLIVGPRGRPPKTVAEMNEYNKQFYAKERA